jgi:hypothetical protein
MMIDFPVEFTQSIRPKFIKVHYGKYFDYRADHELYPRGVSISSDIVQDERYDDGFFCVCNEKTLDKVLQVYDARAKFFLWVKDVYGQIVDLDPTKSRIVVELLLEY